MKIDKEKLYEICYQKSSKEDLRVFIEAHKNQINKYDLREIVNDKLNNPEIFCESLFLAVRNNNKEIIEELLENEYSKKFIDLTWCNSAIFRVACKYGHLEIVKLLLESENNRPKIEDGKIGARFKLEDLSLKREGYGTALGLSTDNNHIEVVRYLLKYDITKKIPSVDINDSFNKSIENGNVGIAEILKNEILSRKNGYDYLDKLFGYNKPTFSLNTTLISSIEKNHLEMVSYLIKEFHYKHNSDFNLHVSQERRELNNELRVISEKLNLYENLNNDTKDDNTIIPRKIKI